MSIFNCHLLFNTVCWWWKGLVWSGQGIEQWTKNAYFIIERFIKMNLFNKCLYLIYYPSSSFFALSSHMADNMIEPEKQKWTDFVLVASFRILISLNHLPNAIKCALFTGISGRQISWCYIIAPFLNVGFVQPVWVFGKVNKRHSTFNRNVRRWAVLFKVNGLCTDHKVRKYSLALNSVYESDPSVS